MLEGRLTVDVERGGRRAVAFEFTVTNVDSEAVGLVFSDAGRADVAVYENEEGGTEVWRWSDGRMTAQVVTEASLQPGESATFEMAWDDPPPGAYRAEASLRAREHDCEATAAFTVPE